MIAGMCKVWARKTVGDDQYWFQLPQAARGYQECQHLVDYYEDAWGDFYEYCVLSAAVTNPSWCPL